MYSMVKSGTLYGIDAFEVTVESDVAFGLPSLNIVGLPDAAVRESRERVRTAIRNSGLAFPDKRVTVNLSPADIRKAGTQFDLAIAVAILISSGKCRGRSEDLAFLGELALDGSLKPVKGILPLLIGLMESGMRRVVIPAGNAGSASVVSGLEIFAGDDLRQVIAFIEGEGELERVSFAPDTDEADIEGPDFSEVIGQENAKRALQAAAAGMHNILMTGPPGAGKTMLARCVPSIMPGMTYEEKLEVTKIYSVYGDLRDQPLIKRRPFRAPDHTVSPAGLVGGGRRIRAGEVTMAHLGILFLDELPEFSRSAIEALRKPMEDKTCSISRVSEKLILPSRFLTVAAMNPCPCGFYGDPSRECICPPGDIVRYRSKMSGPFLDRIDMNINLTVPGIDQIRRGARGASSSELREGVSRAHEIQRDRFRKEGISCNSEMGPGQVRKYCRTDRETENLLDAAFEKYSLSLRSYDRILRVSRTLADLEGSDMIRLEHAAEAISYKCGNDIFR